MQHPSPWLDLCYHVLAHLPIAPGDHSNLHAPLYTAWYRTQLTTHVRQSTPRTLPDDAPLLAALYNACPDAARLQAFTKVHSTLDDFMATAAQPFAEVAPDHAWNQALPEALLELFRIALWSEARSGFLDVHHARVVPLHERVRPRLDALIAEATAALPELSAVIWSFCHPLGRSGRLLTRHGAPWIHVGLPDPHLNVPDWAPVLQGCHEVLLHQILVQGAPRRGSSTRRDRGGYAAFLLPELQALSQGALRLGLRQWSLQAAYEVWIHTFFPNGAEDLFRTLPWREELKHPPSPSTALIPWLAAGHALP